MVVSDESTSPPVSRAVFPGQLHGGMAPDAQVQSQLHTKVASSLGGWSTAAFPWRSSNVLAVGPGSTLSSGTDGTIGSVARSSKSTMSVVAKNEGGGKAGSKRTSR